MPLFKVETISQFKLVYFIEAESKEHAEDEIVMRESCDERDFFDEAKQVHLGEHIFGTQEVTMQDFENWLRNERDSGERLASWWMGDKLIHKVNYGYNQKGADEDQVNSSPEVAQAVFRNMGTSLIVGRPYVGGGFFQSKGGL